MLNKEDALCGICHCEHTDAIASDCDCKGDRKFVVLGAFGKGPGVS
jgi:E3 ubiquitin-protein ligase DOA10